MDLPDGSFSATQSFDANHKEIYARIGADKVSGKSHAWCGKTSGVNAITVDLTSPHIVTGVATQGRGDRGQRVTSYSIRVSENGYDWVSVGKFVGNFDQKTICQVRFEEPVLARFVEFAVLKYYVHPSMRIDVLVMEI